MMIKSYIIILYRYDQKCIYTVRLFSFEIRCPFIIIINIVVAFCVSHSLQRSHANDTLSSPQFVLKLTNMTKDGMSIHMDGQLSMFRLRPCPCCMAAGFSPETTRKSSSVRKVGWYIDCDLF